MKIAVLVKRVPDTATRFQVAGDGKSLDAPGIKQVLNPYDEFAVEQAVQIKEAGGGTVTVFCAGDDKSVEIIHRALAFGCDGAVLVTDPAVAGLDSNGVAQVLAAAIKQTAPDLVLCGKQAVDDDCRQVPERIAEELGFAHVSYVTQVTVNGGAVDAERDIDGGKAKIQANLPAVLTCEKSLNKPRYPKLPNIMKAKKLPLKKLSIAELGLDAAALSAGLELISYAPPPETPAGRILKGSPAEAAAALAEILVNEEKVIREWRT